MRPMTIDDIQINNTFYILGPSPKTSYKIEEIKRKVSGELIVSFYSCNNQFYSDIELKDLSNLYVIDKVIRNRPKEIL